MSLNVLHSLSHTKRNCKYLLEFSFILRSGMIKNFSFRINVSVRIMTFRLCIILPVTIHPGALLLVLTIGVTDSK